MPTDGEAKRRAVVASFGLPTQKMDTKVEALSGGERARLLLGLAMMDRPNLLILDEPTNHLDIQARQSLVDAINGYDGAVILISHDWHLIEMTTDRLWLVEDGRVRPFDGDLEDYRKHILSKNGVPAAAEKTEPSAANKADQRRLAAQKREALAGLSKDIKRLEKEIAGLNQRIALLDAELAAPALYDNPKKAIELAQARDAAAKALAEAEEAWLERSAEYEERMGADD